MSRDKGHFKWRKNQSHYKHKNQIGDKGKEVLQGIDENNPVIKLFQQYAAELDSKHDRYERLVKISRDITIESKRIIFLLHTFDKESKRITILEEADKRLNNLVTTFFKNIALELDGEDPYMYLRAYKPGFQEFVEALTFYWYLKNNMIYHWTSIAESMTYTIEDPKKPKIEDDKEQQMSVQNKTVKTLVEPIEYILGLADLTGELMRKCINNLASGDISSCFQTCNFVRNMYTQFLRCEGKAVRDFGRKLYTLKQSLLKMENICYVIKVRGSEIPKHMIVDVAMNTNDDMNMDDDEGYQAY